MVRLLNRQFPKGCTHTVQASNNGNAPSVSNTNKSYLAAGWLWKRGKTKQSRWLKRWFELTDDQLKYYKKEGELPLGTITLKYAQIGEIPDIGKRKNVFGIITATRLYFLSAGTPAERFDWITTICSQTHLKLQRLTPESLRAAIGVPPSVGASYPSKTTLKIAPTATRHSILPTPHLFHRSLKANETCQACGKTIVLAQAFSCQEPALPFPPAGTRQTRTLQRRSTVIGAPQVDALQTAATATTTATATAIPVTHAPLVDPRTSRARRASSRVHNEQSTSNTAVLGSSAPVAVGAISSPTKSSSQSASYTSTYQPTSNMVLGSSASATAIPIMGGGQAMGLDLNEIRKTRSGLRRTGSSFSERGSIIINRTSNSDTATSASALPKAGEASTQTTITATATTTWQTVKPQPSASLQSNAPTTESNVSMRAFAMAWGRGRTNQSTAPSNRAQVLAVKPLLPEHTPDDHVAEVTTRPQFETSSKSDKVDVVDSHKNLDINTSTEHVSTAPASQGDQQTPRSVSPNQMFSRSNLPWMRRTVSLGGMAPAQAQAPPENAPARRPLQRQLTTAGKARPVIKRPPPPALPPSADLPIAKAKLAPNVVESTTTASSAPQPVASNDAPTVKRRATIFDNPPMQHLPAEHDGVTKDIHNAEGTQTIATSNETETRAAEFEQHALSMKSDSMDQSPSGASEVISQLQNYLMLDENSDTESESDDIGDEADIQASFDDILDALSGMELENSDTSVARNKEPDEEKQSAEKLTLDDPGMSALDEFVYIYDAKKDVVRAVDRRTVRLTGEELERFLEDMDAMLQSFTSTGQISTDNIATLDDILKEC